MDVTNFKNPTIKLFNSSFQGSTANYEKLAKLAYKVGYLIHPNCSTIQVLEFIETQSVDYSSTFYKSFETVTSMTRWELFLDQAKHYASTYGTNFQGKPYLPNQPKDQLNIPEFKTFKVIMPITRDEAVQKCNLMLASGIALSEETIKDILAVYEECEYKVDIKTITNKEAKMWLYKSTNSLPGETVEMIRYLVFLATSKSLLIKDKQTLESIKASTLDITQFITKFGIEELSTVFLRFKPIFLAFKKANSNNSKCINKLRKLAVQNHEPMTVGFWENLLSNPKLMAQVPSRLAELNNFKKITLLETINIRLANCGIKAFGIRNGKIWLTEEKSFIKNDPNYLKLLKSVIYQSLVDSLKPKATTIQLPDGLNLTLPKSEKSFIGNYPLGTTIDLSTSEAIVGINWKESEGASDIDLKLIDIDGKQFGWNADYTNDAKTVIYSGDMTSARPEATELMYASNGFKPAIVKVNLYNGEANSKFKFFVAREKYNKQKQGKNPMINPNNIMVSVDVMLESNEMSLGVITKNKFHLAKFRTGNSQIAGNSITNKYIEYTLQTLDCYINLKTLLSDAGFTIVTSNASIDLTNLSKDSLINLLQGNNS